MPPQIALLVAAALFASLSQLQCDEPIKEPDLTVSKDYGISRRMVTKLVDDELLKNLREDDYARMSLDDPLLQSAYVRVFLNVMDIRTGAGLLPEYAAALHDLKRRGNSAAPLLLKLMKENPYSRFEFGALAAIYLESIDPKPFIEYAREALVTRWDTLPPGDVGRITYLLIRKGAASDLALLRAVVKKRPYLTDQIESEITAAKRPGGPLAAQPEPAPAEHADVKKRDAAKPAASPPPVSNSSSTNWLAWLAIVIAATIGASWLLLRKSSK